MSWPDGVELVTVRLGAGLDLQGGEQTGSALIEAAFDGSITWEPTGTHVMPASFTVSLPAGGAEVQLPAVDQHGWIDAAGQFTSSWGYVITVTINGTRRRKLVRPLMGQTFIDFDLIPSTGSGECTMSTNGVAVVTSLAGLTGPVTQAQLRELVPGGGGGGAVNSVAGLAGDITAHDLATKLAPEMSAPSVPVKSVNGETGDVVLPLGLSATEIASQVADPATPVGAAIAGVIPPAPDSTHAVRSVVVSTGNEARPADAEVVVFVNMGEKTVANALPQDLVVTPQSQVQPTPSNPVRFAAALVYRNSPEIPDPQIVLTKDGWQNLAPVTIRENVGGGTYENGVYTIPVDGMYAINGGARLASGASARNVGFRITGIPNSQDYQVWGEMGGTGAKQRTSRLVALTVYLTAGSQISLGVYSEGSDFAAIAEGTVLQIQRVGA